MYVYMYVQLEAQSPPGQQGLLRALKGNHSDTYDGSDEDHKGQVRG
jgi:hypothetical protein